MATKKPKKTAKLGQELEEKLRGKGIKVKHYDINSKVANKGEGNFHSRTDGRFSGGANNQSYGGAVTAMGADGKMHTLKAGAYQEGSTTSKNGRLAVAKRDENGKIIGTDTKNAKTNLFTPKNDDGTAMYDDKGNKMQSGTHKVGDRSVSEANRRTRDYYTRVGLNNDQRSEEAKARLEATLRSIGASEDEITALTGRGNGNPAPWRAVSTG